MDSDEEYSVTNEKLEFIDYEVDESVHNYNPSEEGPVNISVPFPFLDGKPQSITVGETTADSITLRNTSDDPVELWSMSIYASSPEDTFTLSLMKPPSADSSVADIRYFFEAFRLEDRVLPPGETLTVWVSCKPKEIGLHTSAVQFDVDGDRIERLVVLFAEDEITRSLISIKPYYKDKKKGQFPVDLRVPGQRPARRTEGSYKNKLPHYSIPKELREIIESKQLPDALNKGLTRENYAAYFNALLVMEEIALEESMRRYAMEGVTMKMKRNQFLTLEVPGLAERRPSLVHGDIVFVKLAGQDANDASPPYEGYVHHVEADEVYLKFALQFHRSHRDWNLYDVQFTYNRVNVRRLYHAVAAVKHLDISFLFPSSSSNRRPVETIPFRTISCELNEEQIGAVQMVLHCKGTPPCVIYGPPGTGKTVTLVEAILQLYSTCKQTRILVCAPSNSASDHILEILIAREVEIKESEIFRLNATTRPYEDVRPGLMHFCCFDDDIFKCPPLDILKKFKIIISTYMSASLLHAEGIKRGHFSHIILDEAGQASEPETMIPISNFCQRDTVVVLAGDPMQLGPVVHSQDAETYGLGKSYMERLIECPVFCNRDDNIVKLVRNYRCHRDILHLPSTLFYGGELVPCREDTRFFTSWANLLPDFFPNKEFPVLFLGIQGCDQREGKNPSWFNRFEISKVLKVIKNLREKANLHDEDIGVITPYRQQVNKIKEVLEGVKMSNIKVGSVEQFQGQERKVIIISTVRSTIKHHEFDRLHCLGFLTNPKRFNVAVTRAISSLIIVGNPHIISKDPFWHKLLWYCVDNNSYSGSTLPEKEVFDDEQPRQDISWNHGEQVYQPEPVTDEAEWADGWKEAIPEPWQGGSWNCEEAVTDEAEWADGWKEAIPEPWQGGSSNCEEETHPQTSGVEWGEDRFPEIPKPVTDEGDGWK